jgi:hypothetical protein
MQSLDKQTIDGAPRELLVRLLTHITDGVPFRVTDLGELRALLDVPVEVECTDEMYKAFVKVMHDNNNGSESYKDVVKNAIEAAIKAS